MVFEKFIRYTGPAVGLKPSATGCEARLRGLYRIIFSKTITRERGRPARRVLRGQVARAPGGARLEVFALTTFFIAALYAMRLTV